MGLNLNSSLLINREASLPDISKYATVEESYFASALSFLSSLYEEVNMTNVYVYETGVSTDSVEILEEGVKEIVSKVSTIIDKIIKFISDKVDKFVSILITKKADFAKLYTSKEEVLKKYTSELVFDMAIAKPTTALFNDSIPSYPKFRTSESGDASIGDMIDYVILISSTDIGSKIGNKENKDAAAKEALEFTNTNRGHILNAGRPIDKASFVKEAKSAFLDDVKDIVCTKKYLTDVYEEINPSGSRGISNIIAGLKKSKASAVKDLTAAKAKITVSKFSYIHNNGTSGIRSINLLSKLIFESFSTYIQAITIKMDCAVKALAQDVKCIGMAKAAVKTDDKKEQGTKEEDIPAAEYRDVKESFIELQEAFALYEYDMFLINCQISDNNAKASIKVMPLTEAAEINAILEADLGEMITKLTTKIREIFTRFSRTMNDVIGKDKAYWEKHKAIAGENYAGGAVTECASYTELSTSKDVHIPQWNYDMLKDSLISEQDFIAKHFPKYVPKDGVSFSDTVKTTLRGENKAYNTGFSLKGMYDYCYGFIGSNGYFKSITKDMDDITKADRSAKVTMSQVSKDVKVAAQPANTGQDPTAAKTESRLDSFYKSYFNEVEIEEPKPNNVEGDDTDATRKANTDAIKKDIQSGTSADAVNKAVRVYFNICGAFMGAKMSVSQEAYNDYRKIMIAHIKATRKAAKTTPAAAPAAPGAAEPTPEAKK